MSSLHLDRWNDKALLAVDNEPVVAAIEGNIVYLAGGGGSAHFLPATPPEDRGLGVADPPPHDVMAAIKRIVGKTDGRRNPNAQCLLKSLMIGSCRNGCSRH